MRGDPNPLLEPVLKVLENCRLTTRQILEYITPDGVWPVKDRDMEMVMTVPMLGQCLSNDSRFRHAGMEHRRLGHHHREQYWARSIDPERDYRDDMRFAELDVVVRVLGTLGEATSRELLAVFKASTGAEAEVIALMDPNTLAQRMRYDGRFRVARMRAKNRIWALVR